MNVTDYSDSLDEFTKQEAWLSKEPWYHYGLSREDAEKIIRRNGEFLVRNSTNTSGDFVLTHKWNGRITHLLVKKRVQRLDNKVSISFLYSFGVFEFPLVVELVRYHWVNQLPLTMFSSAVIFRPVHYFNSSQDQGLPWKLGTDPITVSRDDSQDGSLQNALSNVRLTRIAGSVTDLRGSSANNSVKGSLKGSSLLDLRGKTYVDPSLLEDMEYCPPEMLTGCIRSRSTNMSETSLIDVYSDKPVTDSTCSSVLRIPKFDNSSSQTNLLEPFQDRGDVSMGPKPSNVTRKAIRYVEMHDAPQISSTKPNGISNPLSGNCDEMLDLFEMAPGSVDYDLTHTLPSLLLDRIGPVERALDRKAWFELAHLMDKRVFTPLDYASHLTLNLVQMLLPSRVIDQPDRLVRVSALGALGIKLRRDLFNRARFLRLFIIATILMAEKENTRANILAFWLELAQCLLTIFRDQYTLNSVLRAVFSSKIPNTIWTAATIGSNPSVQLVKSSTVEELSACYQALGGRLPDKPDKKPFVRPEITTFDFRTQIPNLSAFLDNSVSLSGQMKQSSLENGQSNERSGFLGERTQLYRVRDLWMWELYSTVKDNNSLLACLSRTETILALLFGPIKLDRGPALDELYHKLNTVLSAMGKMIDTVKTVV